MKYNDSNKPIQCILTQADRYRNAEKMIVKGILWHDTAARNPNLSRYVQPDDNAKNRDELIKLIGKNKYNNDHNHIVTNSRLNAWIGKLADGTVASVQTMPWDCKPWGCGGSCNDGWIQFEICDDACKGEKGSWAYDNGGAYADYFKLAYKEACELTAYLCKMFNIDPLGTVDFKGKKVPTILCHKDSHDLGLGSGHQDVINWFKVNGKTMDDVRRDVNALLNEKKPVEENYALTNVKTRYYELLDDMNFRKTINGDVICVIKKGTVISGNEILTASNGTEWLKTFYNKENGVVAVSPASKGYAKQVADPAEKEKSTTRYFELLQDMYIRKSINGTKLGSIPKGTIISGTNVETASNGTQWLNTSYNGINGKVAVLPTSKGYAREVTYGTTPSKPADKYYPKYTGNSISIADALSSLKIDATFSNRKKIANANGISIYLGTASQNGKLLSLLKEGKLLK